MMRSRGCPSNDRVGVEVKLLISTIFFHENKQHLFQSYFDDSFELAAFNNSETSRSAFLKVTALNKAARAPIPFLPTSQKVKELPASNIPKPIFKHLNVVPSRRSRSLADFKTRATLPVRIVLAKQKSFIDTKLLFVNPCV